MSFYKLFDEFPENRKTIFNAIHYRKHDQYRVMIESLLSEQEPAYLLDQCPECGARSVISCHCEACFEDLKSTSCHNIECETKFLYSRHDPSPECPECGAKV
jgi:hypothetical protein